MFKRHYWMFVIVCLFAASLGAQFIDSIWAETSNGNGAAAYTVSEDGGEITTTQPPCKLRASPASSRILPI